MKTKDLSNQKFGYVTAIKATKNRDHASIVWLCKCDCGNEVLLSARYLKQSDKSPSCGKGCVNKGPQLKEPELNWKSSAHKIYSQYKHKAIKRNLEFTLSFNDAVQLFKDSCHYCKQEPSNIRNIRNSKFIYNGIDRVNNSKGYTSDNCVSCCRICNSAKNDLTIDEFKQWVGRVYCWSSS